MGEVVSMSAYRAGAVLRRAAEHAPTHPALFMRWAAADDGLSHDRAFEGLTQCGLHITGVCVEDLEPCPECRHL